MNKNMIEIERKFLIKREFIDNSKAKYVDIEQAYILKNDIGSVRIRVERPSDSDYEFAYLMSKTKINDSSNHETVDEISIQNAITLIKNFSKNYIKKRRYFHIIDGYIWEVDYFTEPTNLVLAEIELSSIDEKISLPNWIDKEVTGQKEYYNSNM